MKTAYLAPLALTLLPFTSTAEPARDAASAQPARIEGEHELDPRDAVHHATISLRDAIARAVAAQPGRAVEAELEGESDDGELDVFFEVMVLTADGELVEVRLDPKTGAVREKGEAEEDEDEIPGFQAALRHSEFDLAALIEKAGSFVKGTPVAAGLEFEDGSPTCDVTFVHTRYVIEVELEARAGHLVEVELRPEMIDDEHAGQGDEENGEEENGEEDDDGEEENGEEEGEEHEESGEEEEREEHEHAEHHKGGGVTLTR